jgi:hypothetical protein
MKTKKESFSAKLGCIERSVEEALKSDDFCKRSLKESTKNAQKKTPTTLCHEGESQQR